MRDKEEKGGKWEEGEEEKAKDRPWDCSSAIRSACPCTEPGMEGSNIEGKSFEHHMTPPRPHGHSTGGSDLEREARQAGGHLHTDVFWLLSLLGISFTPRDFSSICFLTREEARGKTG